MGRYLTQAGTSYLGAVGDISTPKTFLGPYDPSTVSGGVIRVGDRWLRCGTVTAAGPVYPPGPPGSYDPGVSTVGYLPTGTALTAYPTNNGPFGSIVSGALNITTPGVTISGWNIAARISVKAADVTVRRNLIRGANAPLTTDDSLVNCLNASVTNCLIEDNVLVPDFPSLFWNGIRGHHFTAQRNEIYGVTDGIDVMNPSAPGTQLSTFILANYFHGLSGFGPDTPNSRPFTHNDCIQWFGGTGLTVIGNHFEGFLDPAIGQASDSAWNPDFPQMNTNSVLQVTQSVGPARGLLFDQNWCHGGGATLNFSAAGNTAGSIGSVTNNKFGRDSYFQGGGAGVDGVYGSGGDNSVTFLSAGGFTFASTTGNVYADNGHPITKRIS